MLRERQGLQLGPGRPAGAAGTSGPAGAHHARGRERPSRDHRLARQNGLSVDQAVALLGEFAAARQSDKNERGCGRAALGLIATFSLFVLGLVLYRRPWDGTRVAWTYRGTEIPAFLGFLLFCFMYAGAMTVLWFLAMRAGAALDQVSDRTAPDRRPFVRRFVLLFVVLLGVAALLLYLGS